MSFKLGPKNLKRLLSFLALGLFCVGTSSFLYQKYNEYNQALASAPDNVNVTARVIPKNVNLGYNTIIFGGASTPVVAIDNITVNDKNTNQSITCTFTYSSPSGSQYIVQTQAQGSTSNCIYDPTKTPEEQNAIVIQGDIGDIITSNGIGTVEAEIKYENFTTSTPKVYFRVKDLALNPEAFPQLNLNTSQAQFEYQATAGLQDENLQTAVLSQKISFYSALIVATTVGVTGYILIFQNLISSFKISKYRDFTEELDIWLEAHPSEIIQGEKITFVSKIYDESDKPVNNLDCILTIITPANQNIKIKATTNKDGKAGVYLTKDGQIDNEFAMQEQNLHPATLVKGELNNFNQTPGQGIAYLKAELYSERYRSKQINWSIRQNTNTKI